jgi:hypothetical protein
MAIERHDSDDENESQRYLHADGHPLSPAAGQELAFRYRSSVYFLGRTGSASFRRDTARRVLKGGCAV